MSRRTARRHAFYAEQRRIRKEPCYIGDGQFEHDWRWISDWYGDPNVINGTADCSRAECRICDAVSEDLGPEDFDDDPDRYDDDDRDDHYYGED